MTFEFSQLEADERRSAYCQALGITSTGWRELLMKKIAAALDVPPELVLPVPSELTNGDSGE